MAKGRPALLNAYVGLLALAFTSLTVAATVALDDVSHVPEWILLTAMFAVSESALLLFHHARGRQSLSASEAILVPMLFALSMPQVILAVGAAMLASRPFQRSEGLLRSTFNVSQAGVAAAAAAGTFAALTTGSAFTVADVGASLLAVAVYAAVNHLLVSGAIALAEGESLRRLLGGVAGATFVNLGLNATVGVLFAGTYLSGRWTIALFPGAMAALFLGYRAVIRQSQERHRIASLHEASRALAVSPALPDALTGFLTAVREIASTREARVVVEIPDGFVYTAVTAAGVEADMEPLDLPMADLLHALENGTDPLIVNLDDGGEPRALADALGARGILAVPLLDGTAAVGLLVAMDRLGAEEFGPEEAQLLESLGHELVLTMDSYRLFEQVREERERFRKIFDGSKDGICLLDEEGVVRAWNPALERISGFGAPEMLGHRWSDRLELRAADDLRLEGIQLTEVPPDEELELVTKDGSNRWVSFMQSAVTIDHGKGWVVLVRDVTAEHLVEEAKSDFLSTLSHEFRTPLTTIKGSMEILGQDAVASNAENRDRMMGVMSRGVGRLERLVMNLLLVSQIETDGRVKLMPSNVELTNLLDARTDAILDGHPFTLRIDPSVSTVYADKERIAQALDHLLENARKFASGGEVRIEVLDRGEHVEISVSDSGPGIPTVDRERIFDRFVRLGDVMTRETQGPGVGLFIVKKVIEASGGETRVESIPGEGSTFSVTIPRTKEAFERWASLA